MGNTVDSRRVKNPANGVVDGLGFRECLVPGFMGCYLMKRSIIFINAVVQIAVYPETSREETRPKAVKSPDRETSQGVESGRGKRKCLRVDQCIGIGRDLIKDRKNKHVPKPGQDEPCGRYRTREAHICTEDLRAERL